MSKRPHQDDGASASSGAQVHKKFLSNFEPIKFTGVRSMEELDKRTLQLQNKRLYDGLIDKRKEIHELRERIEQLEHRQTKDDELLCIINRYWNQLDEDCLIMLQRFDVDSDETVSSSAESFIKQLSTWDKEEVDEKLNERVHFSKRIVSRVLSAFDKTQRRLDRLRKAVAGNHPLEKSGVSTTAPSDKHEGEDEEHSDSANTSGLNLEETVCSEMKELSVENSRIHEMCGVLQAKQHELNLRVLELQDVVQQNSDKAAEWQAKYEDVEYKLSETLARLSKVDRCLSDAQQSKKSLEEELSLLKGVDTGDDDGSGAGGGVAKSKFNELASELEESRELSVNRLAELESLQKALEEKVEEAEKLKSELREIPDTIIVDSVMYKSLKVQFNILYNEAVKLRSELEEARVTIKGNRQAHLRQIEEMEANEAAIQKQMRADMLMTEDQNSQLRKDFEILELDFKQTMAQNEQAGPINSEMRSLISTLQVHNKQLKNEAQRYRKRFKDSQTELTKAKEDFSTLEDEVVKLRDTAAAVANTEATSPSERGEKESGPSTSGNAGVASSPFVGGTEEGAVDVKPEEGELITPDKSKSTEKDESLVLKDLKAQLKKSQDSQKELTILLDMYKVIPKEQRDKVILLQTEQRLRGENEDLKTEVARLREREAKRSSQLREPDPDTQRKMRKLEESLHSCQQRLAVAKQEEDALLKEMEVTGQAFEDVQEQNSRLLLELREKNEANLKLMSERMKATQLTKLLKDDKGVIDEQLKMMQAQIEAHNRAFSKQEEKERLLLSNMATLEKEITSRQQAQELYKRKSVDSQQSAEDLRMNLQKYLSQLKEAQNAVQEKAASLERESFRHQRIQEELATIRKKYERLKKIEQSHNADEVLLAEIQDYKEQLTCPTCKTNRKDAILTKCFHVFCLNCLKTRYETRNRKCPKCNATFGANDYHRIYLC